MVWKRWIVLVIVLAAAVTLLALPRVYYARNGAVGYLMWNSAEAYVFLSVFQYGYSSSYLGVLGELVKEILPFGASPPEKKHFYVVVLHITPEAVQHYSVENVHLGSAPFVVGQTIYASNLLTDTGPTRWSGADFEPMTSEEQQEVRDAFNGGRIPAAPSYNNVDGWSRRMVDVASPAANAEATIKLGKEPLMFLLHCGVIDHEAYIDLARSGNAPERIWHMSERPERVTKATYNQTFEK